MLYLRNGNSYGFVSFRVHENIKERTSNYPERYSIKTLPFSPLSYHGHSCMVVVPKGSQKSYSIHCEAESRFWSRRGCGESLHLVIEENRHRLFLRITSISRFRKRSMIVQKYTQYCYPKLFYDRLSILLTVWTTKTKKIFCFYRAEAIKHLDVIETELNRYHVMWWQE